MSWKHYFGGFGFLTIVLQLITGLYLIFFYDPSLAGAYKSIQYISNQLYLGGLTRNLHRWISAIMFFAILVHTIRSFLRSDFRNPKKKILWLTGVLLLLPIFLFVVTGIIVPWEWKGYWFMEMIPNYFEPLPYIGPGLKTFFIESFTVPRYYVFHILVLPIISTILIDYHMFERIRKRGLFRYLVKHSIITFPFIILLIILAVKMQIPSNDPIDIPMPLEGEWVIAPEWYVLTFFLPFLYVKGIWVPVFSLGVPIFIFLLLAFLPYLIKSFRLDEMEFETARFEEISQKTWWHSPFRKKIVNGIIVTVIALIITGLLFAGNKKSPTLGCNSCHNTSRGVRMGTVPAQFKDRTQLPHLDENDWMIGHWYYPDIVW